MKRIILTILILIAVLLFPGCQKEAPVEIDLTQLESEISSADIFTTELSKVGDKYVTSTMFISLDGVDSYFVYSQAGQTGEEFGAFSCSSKDEAAALVGELKEHIDNFIELHKGYAEDAVPRLKNAIIEQNDKYVAFIIAEDNSTAQKILDNYF
ncbi:MAG: DUF4358 domain-containing protein [Ruminococcaceae bacterium]|nr:DUF4358 domain-containing protein [Oscillospiraceae bacterium]